MTPEEKLYLKHEKARFLFVGFNPPELKLIKAWLHAKHLTNIVDVRGADDAWSKMDLSAFHFIFITVDSDANEALFDRMVDSHRFPHTPLFVFSRSPEVYQHSYAKRNLMGRYCHLPVNMNEVEKQLLATMQEGKVEKSQIGQLAGAMHFYNDGCKNLLAGNLAGAKENFRLALKEDPKLLDGFLKMGETLIDQEDYDTALRVLEKAHQIAPDDARAPFLTGRAFFEKGDEKRAVEEFEKALAMEKNNVKMIMDIGNLFLEKNRIDEALSYFNMAKDKSPDFLYIYNRIGIALSRAGRFDEAEQTYNHALAIDKEDAGLYFNIGMMWHRRQNDPKSVEFFKKAVELDPFMKEAREMLAKVQPPAA
ncbi:MAG: tetratricopeptide repeat protein [Nitrospinae bacterium]|nr:tetratricopeptide repeat protein [Nitrospinota bacterium]